VVNKTVNEIFFADENSARLQPSAGGDKVHAWGARFGNLH